MLNSEFSDFAGNDYDFYPAELGSEIDALNKKLYERVNNGVCLAGFATSQRPCERAAKKLFETLDQLDARLASQRYLLGQRMTEAERRKRHYITHDDINPTRIAPIGPTLDLEAPHGRERLGAQK